MKCPKCGSENVLVQVATKSKLINKHHNILWWLFIGWWWIFIKWIIFTIPALIFAIFGHKKQKIKQIEKSICVCQNCGNRWDI